MTTEFNRNNQQKSFWEFFTRNYKFTLIILVATFLMGVVSIIQIPKESMPEVDFPIAFVATSFIGASAADVEELITTPLENELINLEKVSSITSSSSNGISTITVQFDVDSNSMEQISDLKDKVDQVKISLPENANDPMVRKLSFNDLPVLTLSLSGPFPLPQLQDWAEEIKGEIKRASGVSQVLITGGQEREIRVIVDKAKLDEYGLALSQVNSAIQQANSDIPIGEIETANENFNLRFSGKLSSAAEIEETPIMAINNSLIYVKDVANVVDTFSEQNSLARLSVDGGESRSSVSIKIYKVNGGNVLNTVNDVKEIIDASKNDILPDGVELEIIEDWGKYVKQELGNLSQNGLQTILIVMVLLLIFLGWREAILASAGIPLTFLITFLVLNQIGYTLNFLTLFSLILALGLLVDGAIVITEGMHNKLLKGIPAKDAAILTIREFRLPLISGILTTVFAFLPMILTSGIIGEYIKSIPVTITVVLLASLFVALGLIPAIGAKLLAVKKKDGQDLEHKIPKEKDFIKKLNDSYEKLLDKLLNTKKLRRLFAFIMGLAFVLSLSLPMSGLLKINMFTPADEDNFTINVIKPIGSTLSDSNESIRIIEEILKEDDRIAKYLVNVGSGSAGGQSYDLTASSSSSHLAHITVQLRPDRKEFSFDIVDEYQKKLFNLLNDEIIIEQAQGGPPSEAPVLINIVGDDLNEMEKLAQEYKKILNEIDGAINVDTNIVDNNGEFVISIDRAKAQLYGLSAIQVAMTLRNAIYGSTATTIQNNNEDIDVIVKYALDPSISPEEKSNVSNLANIETLTIATPGGDIPLANFTTNELANSRAKIEHKEGERIIKVSSDVSKNYTAQEVIDSFEASIDLENLPDGIDVSFGGETEDIAKSFADMGKAMLLGIFMIAALLVWQFKSFRQPLFILTTIPLSLIGVFPGLTLLGQTLNFPGIIGIVALVGIVVNNAIILIDRINENRFSGMDKKSAIKEAGKSRLQPIILTTITTVAGILPLAISSVDWGALGYAIICGLSFSTILTLIVVPLLYDSYGEKELER